MLLFALYQHPRLLIDELALKICVETACCNFFEEREGFEKNEVNCIEDAGKSGSFCFEEEWMIDE